MQIHLWDVLNGDYTHELTQVLTDILNISLSDVFNISLSRLCSLFVLDAHYCVVAQITGRRNPERLTSGALTTNIKVDQEEPVCSSWKTCSTLGGIILKTSVRKTGAVGTKTIAAVKVKG